MVLLLDEPTWDLDPLNTYFIISILANHAKKYNRIVMITMEKPRSDIFPFLDRVTYLCLGDVVYTGATRMMLDYFRSIGFPCPELENPLMSVTVVCFNQGQPTSYFTTQVLPLSVHGGPAVSREVH